jgi:hypothetical protein
MSPKSPVDVERLQATKAVGETRRPFVRTHDPEKCERFSDKIMRKDVAQRHRRPRLFKIERQSTLGAMG